MSLSRGGINKTVNLRLTRFVVSDRRECRFPGPRPLRHDPTMPNRTVLPNFAAVAILPLKEVSGQADPLEGHGNPTSACCRWAGQAKGT